MGTLLVVDLSGGKGMGRLLIPVALAMLLLLGAPSSRAHSSEFIGAKLQTGPGRLLTVEVTADFGENPMITSFEEARSAILKNLEVEAHSGFVPMPQLAPMDLAEQTQPDRTSPLPTDPSDKPHKLLRGTWSWEPPPDIQTVRFRVPSDVVHSTIFWLHDESIPKTQRKWSMLLGGDTTPAISLPKGTSSWNGAVFAVIFIALATFLWVRRT